MSKRVFDYNGLARIGVEGPASLVERISESMESEISPNSATNCSIRINQAEHPVEIVKDKKYDYLSISSAEKGGIESITYKRYNTLVRTISRIGPCEYAVDTNTSLDESAGLICMRNYLTNHLCIGNRPLLHSSLVAIGNRGVLIPGDSQAGKTTLAVYFLQEKGASLIGDENIILDPHDGRLDGVYFPRTIRVRFKTVSDSKLSKVLDDLSLINATQYIDADAIDRIIKSGSFDVEAGLAFSKRSFCRLLGASSGEKARISTVILPRYCPDLKTAYLAGLTKKEGISRLSTNGLAKKLDLDPKELGKCTLDLDKGYFDGIDFFELNFSGFESLLNGGIRL